MSESCFITNCSVVIGWSGRTRSLRVSSRVVSLLLPVGGQGRLELRSRWRISSMTVRRPGGRDRRVQIGDEQPLRADRLEPDAGQADERCKPESTERAGPKRGPGRRLVPPEPAAAVASHAGSVARSSPPRQWASGLAFAAAVT